MKARINNFIAAGRQQYLTLELLGDFRGQYDELSGKDIDLTVKQYREKRSLDANAYCWVLLGKLAEKTGIDRCELYRATIKEIGGNSETVCVRDKAVERLVNGWTHNGMGWVTDTFQSKIEGCTNVILYYGSSTYDTRQMSRLIDLIVQECRQQGIETMTPEQLTRLKGEW